MQRSFQQSGLFALSLSILFSSILFAQTKQTPAQRWEYMTVQVCNRQKEVLDKYGDDGWEIVSVFGESSGGCGDYTFKRLKPANAPKYIDPNERPKPSPNAPTCNLTAAQSPSVRGVRLGMTAEDLLRLFPGSDPNYVAKRIEQTQGDPYFGVVSVDFNGSQHQEREQGVSFLVTLFDKRVVAVSIRYQLNNHTNYGQVFSLDQFTEKIAAAYKLPAKEDWADDSNYPRGQVVLKCKEIEFQINILNLTFSIIEPSYLEKQQQRRLEALAKKRAEVKP
jgi:hypothetical protein